MPGLPIVKPKSGNQDLRLINSAKRGDLNTLLDLIKQGVDLNDADAKGDTALIYASMAGHVNAVLALLEAGADYSLVTVDGWDAYHAAMFFGDFRGATMPPHDEIMNIIVEHGYDPKTWKRHTVVEE